MKNTKIIFHIAKNEELLVSRDKFNYMLTYIFFSLIIFIFPLSFSYDSEIINYFLPVVIWVSIIICSLISIEYSYREEYENSYVDYLILSSNRLPMILYGKIFIGWFLSGVPLSLISFSLFYFLTSDIYLSRCLLKMLVPGTLTIHCLGCVGSIITMGLIRSNVLLILIVIPLLTPVLLLSLHAMKFAGNNMPYDLQFVLSCSFMSFSLLIIPTVSTFLLKLGID